MRVVTKHTEISYKIRIATKCAEILLQNEGVVTLRSCYKMCLNRVSHLSFPHPTRTQQKGLRVILCCHQLYYGFTHCFITLVKNTVALIDTYSVLREPYFLKIFFHFALSHAQKHLLH